MTSDIHRFFFLNTDQVLIEKIWKQNFKLVLAMYLLLEYWLLNSRHICWTPLKNKIHFKWEFHHCRILHLDHCQINRWLPLPVTNSGIGPRMCAPNSHLATLGRACLSPNNQPHPIVPVQACLLVPALPCLQVPMLCREMKDGRRSMEDEKWRRYVVTRECDWGRERGKG